MGTMRAAFFEARGTMAVREVPVPEPGPGQVRLKVRYCGICGSDLSLFKTGALAGPDVVLGHEVSGAVDHDPSGTWLPGARVTTFPAVGCGTCMWCREGHPRYCLNPPPPSWGAYAEYVVRPLVGLIPIPDGLDEQAAALAEPLGVALRAVARARPGEGDLAYVSGLGPIGLFAVAGLAQAGCRVVGADPRADRRALALEMGAEDCFDNTRLDPAERMLAADRHGPRLAFECSGVPSSLEQTIDACGPRGTVGILGIPTAPILLLRMTIREQFAFSISGPSPESMRRAIEHLRARPRTAKAITGTVPLGRLEQTMTELIQGGGGAKVLVDPSA